MELSRDNTYDIDMIFIDGHSCSGKSLYARILECYQGVEKAKEDEVAGYRGW